ncbi:Bug family tripartite tricarboxylate transporter substrate binding protein [Muricoccus pecuniae]|uniref:Tripartite-type tricarboxylate transporter receptor subunit TctC n=1 Tax=Muricoccus pecuniae TaxID=693023 RepID=A0A840Y535_9PROT|nr:tripartite tricarboxylate transporter substrate binding protein [Roseomonas pecuniae]MBB5696238.1 tripartite-type tricarboxylate transporter receptor subunit TctC [Roseomonas pecuniae]
MRTKTRRDIPRRTALGVALAFGLPTPLRAQASWPRRPVRIVVPFAPGASNDLITRAAAVGLQAILGVSVVVENRPGAGGTIGAAAVAQSPPDGYTLLIASASLPVTVAVQPVPYNPVRDFQAVRLLAVSPMGISVAGTSPYRTLADVVTAARGTPGGVRYGSAGPGGLNHLAGVLFGLRAGIELEHVPYRGIAPAIIDMLGGRIEMIFPSIASAKNPTLSGEQRLLAVFMAERHPDFPNVPTARELGYDLELASWYGIVGPTGIPRPVVDRLDEALQQVVGTPDMQRFLVGEGAIPGQLGADAFQQLIATDTARWAEIARAGRLQ